MLGVPPDAFKSIQDFLLVCVYTLSLYVLDHHPTFTHHQYPDDSLINVCLQTHISKCLFDITTWMSNKCIKLSVKAEILIFPQFFFLSKFSIGQKSITSTQAAQAKTKVILDLSISLPPYIHH